MQLLIAYSEGPLMWLFKCLKWAVSVSASMWLAAGTDIKILCVLFAVDVLISLVNRSVVLMQVLRRIAITLILVGTIHYVYFLAKTQAGLNLGFDISAVVSIFYCLGESVIILRNCDAVGIRLPPALLDLLAKAEGITGQDREEIIALKLKQDQETTALQLKITQSKEKDRGIIQP